MKKQEVLCRELAEMIKETKAGKIRWSVEVQTSEANKESEKLVEEVDGIHWTVDECYVSYFCKFRDQEFCMITYEMIKTAGSRTASTNMVFLPPLGMRLFNLHTLLPYSMEISNVLISQIRMLWEMLLDMYKVDKSSVYLDVKPATVTIED